MFNIQKIQKFFSPYGESDNRDFGYKVGFFILYLIVLFVGIGSFGDFIGIGIEEAIIIYNWTSFFIVGTFALQRIRYIGISYWWLFPVVSLYIGVQILYLGVLYITRNREVQDWFSYGYMRLSSGGNTLVPHKSFKEWKKLRNESRVTQEETSKKEIVVTTNIHSETFQNKKQQDNPDHTNFIPKISRNIYIPTIIISHICILCTWWIWIPLMIAGGEAMIAKLVLSYLVFVFFLSLGRLQHAGKPLPMGLIIFIPFFPFAQVGFLLYLCFV